MNLISATLIFVGLMIGGFVIESLLSQFHHLIFGKHMKKYHYSFSRYLFYLTFPVLAIVFSYFYASPTIVFVFIAFAAVGTFSELIAGFTYHMVVGQRLWTYHRYSINGYTSLFSVPLWGCVGVLFWFLTKII